ncbi:pentapeptide repeat-containing protein, partial [Solibaculum intestinale]
MKKEEIQELLKNHKLWLSGDGDGRRADLTGADLTGANLTGANLTYANLTDADLTYANLTDANLTDANLTCADLMRADLMRANLRGANLTDADLTYANLTDADLMRANLTGANLTGANLTDADLTCADLTGANGLVSAISYLSANFEQCKEGYIAYKTFGAHYNPPASWSINPGSEICETVNSMRTNTCGNGINVAPLEWVKQNASGNALD